MCEERERERERERDRKGTLNSFFSEKKEISSRAFN
jgi:hypothetical protein